MIGLRQDKKMIEGNALIDRCYVKRCIIELRGSDGGQDSFLPRTCSTC